jgi:hypothetical protein
VQRLVDAAIKKALEPWERRKEKEKAIDNTCGAFSLPWDFRETEPWKTRIREAVTEAVYRIRDGARRGELDTAASAAIQPILSEYRHHERCANVVGLLRLPDANADERESATDAVREALAPLLTASDRQLEQARDRALEPIRAMIAARKDQEMRESLVDDWRLAWRISDQQALQETREEIRAAFAEFPACTPERDLEAERDRIVDRAAKRYELIKSGIGQIRPLAEKLIKEYDYQGEIAWSIESRVKEAVRSALEDEITGEETPDEVRKLVYRVMKDEEGCE